MTEIIAQFSDFHFIRPWWLLALPPAMILCIALWRQKKHSSAWKSFIDAKLLKHLLEGQVSQSTRWQIFALLGAWMVATVSLAGPSWQKIPQPVHQSQAAVVILLDLSPSMLAEDIKPSRLVRMRYKLTDFLNARDEGVTALIAYAGEAHVVSPLTDDINTITNLLPALDPSIMPLPGSNIEMAVALGKRLFTDAGITYGEILVATDGIAPEAFAEVRSLLSNSNFNLSILGVGSTDGAPIPTGDGGFIRDGDREVVLAKLNRAELRQLSAQLGGTYSDLRPDEADINTLLADSALRNLAAEQRLTEREFDVWRDQGPWLALLLLPFVALCFRRGWVLSIVLIVGLQPETSFALDWRDLWWRKDQQGQRSLQQGDPATAAQQFKSPDWRGTANYRADNFAAAAESFAQNDSATADFNRGNALAKNGDLEAALEAYQSAMAKRDNFEDAQFNHDLVKKLLDQQKQQQSQAGESEQNEESGDQQQQQQAQQSQSQQAAGQEQRPSGEQPDQQAQSQQQMGEQEIDEQSAQELADREQEAQELSEEQQQQLQQAQQNQQQASDQPQEQSNQQLLAERDRRESEEQQALEQWLRQIPDDPSGLMRRKFDYEYRKLLQEYRRGQWQPPTELRY